VATGVDGEALTNPLNHIAFSPIPDQQERRRGVDAPPAGIDRYRQKLMTRLWPPGSGVRQVNQQKLDAYDAGCWFMI
jgi:hypothetical protein